MKSQSIMYYKEFARHIRTPSIMALSERGTFKAFESVTHALQGADVAGVWDVLVVRKQQLPC